MPSKILLPLSTRFDIALVVVPSLIVQDAVKFAMHSGSLILQVTVMPEAQLVDDDDGSRREPVHARLGKRPVGEWGDSGRQQQRQRQAGNSSGGWPERHQRSPVKSLRDAPQLGSTRAGNSHRQVGMHSRLFPFPAGLVSKAISQHHHSPPLDQRRLHIL